VAPRPTRRASPRDLLHEAPAAPRFTTRSYSELRSAISHISLMPGRVQETNRLIASTRRALFSAGTYGNVGSSIYYALGVHRPRSPWLDADRLRPTIRADFLRRHRATYAEAPVMFPEAGRDVQLRRPSFQSSVQLVACMGADAQLPLSRSRSSCLFVATIRDVFLALARPQPGTDVLGGAALVRRHRALQHRGTEEVGDN